MRRRSRSIWLGTKRAYVVMLALAIATSGCFLKVTALAEEPEMDLVVAEAEDQALDSEIEDNVQDGDDGVLGDEASVDPSEGVSMAEDDNSDNEVVPVQPLNDEFIKDEEVSIADTTADESLAQEGTLGDMEGSLPSAIENKEETHPLENESPVDAAELSASSDSNLIFSTKCGDNLTLTVDEDGVLTVSGEGDMYSYMAVDYGYSGMNRPEWIRQTAIRDSITRIVITDGVTSIGEFCFPQMPSLTSVYIGKSVKYIYQGAFQNCYSLQDITFAKDSQLSWIGFLAFAQCHSLRSLTLPASLRYTDKSAFVQNSALREVVFPDDSKLQAIGMWMFAECPRLRTIHIPDSVKTIEEYAFSQCTALESVVIPSSVTEIGNSAFRYCSSLVDIDIPSSVESIGRSAFYNCNRLSTLIVRGENTAFGESCFANVGLSSHGTIYVTSESNYAALQESGCYSPDYMDLVLAEEGIRRMSDLTVTIASPNAYTGEPLTPTVTLMDGDTQLVEGEDYSVLYRDNVEVGTGTIVLEGKGKYIGKRSDTFAIEKAQSSITLTPQSKVYTGKALAYSGKVTKTGSSGTVTYEYYTDAKCTKVISEADVKAAGIYYVKALVDADANYEAATSKAVKFTISKAANPITAKSASKAVTNSQAHTVAPIAVSKAQGAKTFVVSKWTTAKAKSYFTLNKSNGKVSVKAFTPEGTYKFQVKVTAAGNANYKSGSKTVTVTVTVKALDGTWKRSGSQWWYEYSDGNYPKSAFVNIDGKTYRFDAKGYMVTGWKQIGGNYYYFGSDGAMRKSTWAGNYWLKADGTMATSEWVDGGKYWVGADGAWVKGKTR